MGYKSKQRRPVKQCSRRYLNYLRSNAPLTRMCLALRRAAAFWHEAARREEP
jgi:hypothetical protein